MRSSRPRPALTLIELLVVIIIITTIVAAAIPVMAPTSEDRRNREATRGLTTYILGAQSRAIALQRPFGIAIKRLSQDTSTTTAPKPDDNAVSVEVFYAEQLPAYTGFDENSRCRVALNQLGLATVQFVTRGTPKHFNLPSGWIADIIPSFTIRPGDIIEIAGTQYIFIDHTLPEFRRAQLPQPTAPLDKQRGGFYGSPQNNESMLANYIVRPINDTGQMLPVEHDNNGNRVNDPNPGTGARPAPLWTAPVPFKILRQPTITSEEPYQLPEGTAIDLRASGIGENDYFYVPGVHDNKDYIYVMFTPEGRVERVRYNQKSETGTSTAADVISDEPVVDNVFLLVGRRENAPPPAVDDDPTLELSAVNAATTDEARQELRETVNWLNNESRWVVIGPQSGRVVTVENAFVDLATLIQKYTASPSSLAESSEPLRTKQIIAAREFTREMSQLGGR